MVIDITGAKKTMVAGAYLLAVYARARISYVDSKRWNDSQGRPYGYSCHIRDDVPNPLRDWALQDWERVKEQYIKYNFTAAIEAIPEKGPAALTAASARLKSFLEVCAAWEAGDLATAKELTDKLPDEWQLHVPLAVGELGDLWPTLSEERKDWLKTTFLLNPRALVIYAEDELARARRLSQRKTRPDNRAAFVRAYAVYETLLKARVLILLESDEITFDATRISKGLLQQAMLYEMTSSAAKGLLTGSSRFKGASRTSTSLSLIPPTGIDEENLERNRNLFVHCYAPVSSNHVDEAIDLARKYLTEFKENWGEAAFSALKMAHPPVYAADPAFDKDESFALQAFAKPSWETVKKLSGLDVLLPTENIEEVR